MDRLGQADVLNRLPALGLRRPEAGLQDQADGGAESQDFPGQRQGVLRSQMSRQVVALASEVAPGSCKIVSARGRQIGLFNIGGEYFALSNRCPHKGAELCRGMIVGFVGSDGPGQYSLSRPGEFIRCPWHGWEFDIRTGQSWCDPNSVRARQFKVTVELGATLLKGPYVAETFPVTVEENYLVIDI